MVADERFYPKKMNMNFETFIRHYERYFQCIKMLEKIGKNEIWLDSACGTGYGSNFLSNFCERTIGYDIDCDTIEYAKNEYENERVLFVNDLEKISSNSFDVIFSVETIEHMSKMDANLFLRTLHNFLKNKGTLVITTPIVTTTNLAPKNKFHFIEYSNQDFISLLNDNGFDAEKTNFVSTMFTDGEIKKQGYYRCKKTEVKYD